MPKTHDPQQLGPNVYRHYKTDSLYRVITDRAILTTNGPDDGRPAVVYVSLTNGHVFVRAFDEFYSAVDLPEGGSVLRFERAK
jgi:hypothetical protein